MAYGICKAKNIDSVVGTYEGMEIQPNAEFTVPDLDRPKWMISDTVYAAIASGKLQIGDASGYYTDKTQQWNIVIDNIGIPVTSMPPFADPLYRTKMDATSSVITISANSSQVTDFYITEERYVAGGKLIVTGAQIGDYVTAEVYDKDSIIPSPYRAALCESWPSVAKYIYKMWVDPNMCNEIDTRPLNAKVSAGLYLRVTYYACAEGSDRKVAMNYYLTKKL